MSSESHVFLSFSSHDTGKRFTDHLHTALLNAGIQTHDAMEKSKIALVVLSKNYVLTMSCLDELANIIDRKEAFGLLVIPIFYDVGPSFEQAFDQRGDDDDDKVKRWRHALGQVLDLEGMVLRNRHESKFIKEIVKVVERILNRRSLSVALYPIGLDSRVKSINQWLQDGSTHVGIMGLYGMGGIGKTTVAKTVYNLNFDKFDGSSFISSIRGASEQPNGLVRLQRQLLSDISRMKIKKIHNIDEGIMKIRDAISSKRVFIVLDDVDQLDELNAMLGLRKWFHPGSKIIITTRHKSLLMKSKQQVEMCEIKGFNGQESLELFSWHAFGEDHPPDHRGYTKLSRNVVYHCGGIPLALVILGSSLRGRSVDIWESALKKLQAISERDIVGKLRISYDSLPDDHDRSLFLDISCFFVGKEKEYAMMILEKCDYYTEVGIQNLVDRCLLDIDKQNKLLVHQLLQDMGREIIRQESPHPGRRTRIWSHRDSYNVLRDKSGRNEIRGLALDMKMLKEGKPMAMEREERKKRSSEDILEKLFLMDQSYASKRRRLDFFGNASNASSSIQDDIDFKTDTFTKMEKLRLLKLSHIQITGCYHEFPKGLRWLYWRGFPFKYIPQEFPLESLVALDMRNSNLTQFQKRINGSLMMMEVLNFSHCHYLKKSPDFSMLPNLKRLILKECIRLVELHESIGGLTRLVLLNLYGCRNLRRLPPQFHRLRSLENLILSGCSKLENLPVRDLGKLQSLKMLHADEIAISHIASNKNEVIEWRSFFPRWLSKPQTCRRVPINFSLASFSRSLLSLSLAHCNLSDEAIPSDLTGLCSLTYLNLSGNPIREVPETIKDLYMLRDLWLDSCTSLQSLPELPMSLVDLKTVNCTSLERITNLPNLLNSLFLDVSGCEKLVEVQGLFILEPIRNFGVDRVINELGILNLDTIQNTTVELFNKLTKTRQRDVVQGLFEFGIFSCYVPGNVIPGWCSRKNMVNSISVILPSDPKDTLHGFNICLTYGRSNNARKFRHWNKQDWCTYYIKMNNKTKGLKWVYSPTFIGIPDDNGEDITMISHWKCWKEVENGDDITVSIVGMSYCFQMKGFDIDVMYVQEGTGTGTGLLSAYQLKPHAYFLSNPEYFMLTESGDGTIGDSTRTSLYENLFEGSSKVTGSAYEGGQEEDDSGYDYPDSDEEYDDDDEDWLNAILHAPQ